MIPSVLRCSRDGHPREQIGHLVPPQHDSIASISSRIPFRSTKRPLNNTSGAFGISFSRSRSQRDVLNAIADHPDAASTDGQYAEQLTFALSQSDDTIGAAMTLPGQPTE